MVTRSIFKKLMPVAIILSFFNFPVLGILRLGDLIVIFLSLFSARLYKAIVIFSALCGLHSLITFDLRDFNLFWYVKFLLAFSALFAVDKYVKLELKSSVALLKWSLTLFISWVYVKLLLVLGGVISGSPRASFPTSDYSIVDSHLYAQVLTILGFSVGFVTYLRSGLERPNILVVIATGGIWLLANVLTSSRNGVAITAVFFILLVLIVIFKVVIRGILNFRYVKSFGFLFFIVFGLLMRNYDFVDSEELYALINRSLVSLSASDASTSVRLSELSKVLYEVNVSRSLFGSTVFGGRIGFYDGILTLSLAIFGSLLTGFFLGSAVLFVMYFIFVKKYYFSAIIITVYFMQNLISEFVFVSRGAVFSLFAILVVLHTEREIRDRKLLLVSPV